MPRRNELERSGKTVLIIIHDTRPLKKSFIFAVIAAAVAVPAGVYAASALFINPTIDESLPVADDKNDDSMTEKTKIQY